MKLETEKRINNWWESIEALYTSNELTESQYRTQTELLKSICYAENEKSGERMKLSTMANLEMRKAPRTLITENELYHLLNCYGYRIERQAKMTDNRKLQGSEK